MSATVTLILGVIMAGAIVAIINGAPAPLQDDETTWP
jgi:hypothetical protein